MTASRRVTRPLVVVVRRAGVPDPQECHCPRKWRHYTLLSVAYWFGWYQIGIWIEQATLGLPYRTRDH
jgi:hypothetical protein